MGRVLKAAGIDEDPFLLIIYFMDESINPNVNRKRLLLSWVKSGNSQVLITVTNISGKSIAHEESVRAAVRRNIRTNRGTRLYTAGNGRSEKTKS